MGTHRKLRFWTHSGVKVYDNTAAPTSWTDLDLSSVVGKNRALVFVKVKNRSGMISPGYLFRSGGETENVGKSWSDASGNNIIKIEMGNIGHIAMETNSSGIIEWYASNAELTDVWVLGYIK